MLDFISYTQFASPTLSISIKDTLLAVREFLLHSVSALLCHNNVKKAMDAVFSADPVIQLMEDVIEEEKEHHILQSCELRHMKALLLHNTAHFQSQPEVVQETLKIWLQLLHNSLTQAISIFHRSRASSLQCFMCNPARLSKEIKEWKLLFNYLLEGLLRDFSKFVSDEQFFIAPVITPTDLVIQLMKDVIEEVDNRQILQTDLRPINNHLLDLTDILLDQQDPGREILRIWLQLLHNCLEEAKSILHRYNPQQRQRRPRDCLMWIKVLFDYLFKGLQRDISMFVAANQIPPIPPTRSVEPRSKDEAWKLFKRIAFKNSPVSEDIEEYARKIADECSHLAITRVAAAMIGKNSVDEWKSCLSSIKMNEDPSHPPLVDKQLRWCYDALPNSNVQNCFLYCVMYNRRDRYDRCVLIHVEELVEAWIAEGLVKSKEGSHLMDMAIGRTYIKLLIDRCFFQSATESDVDDARCFNFWQLITVDDVVRDVAIYIGEKDKCGFKAGQKLHNFPETENEDCKRISVMENGIENLPTEFIRPKLVSLFLSHNPIEELPVGFLVSLTSLKVLDLSTDVSSNIRSEITSIPASIGHLKQLEFLNLRGLSIKHLPKEIGQLSSLQFLNISWCTVLQSLPSEIGGLTNLKSLDLSVCHTLRVIPDEISQLILLNKLRIDWGIAVSEANIWKMKDLRNLTTLKIQVAEEARIRVGIMGYWLEMRHLQLDYSFSLCELPDDMQKMSKLQRFILAFYDGLSLPNNTFKFQHLEYIKLDECRHLKDLSPLERLPNLKYLWLFGCDDLKELGIGNSGGFLMLEKLFLLGLFKLESIGGACNNGVWNERVLPRLRMMEIVECPLLKRLPVGMDKLRNLRSISGRSDWWKTLIWEDESMKTYLQKKFTTDGGLRSMFDQIFDL